MEKPNLGTAALRDIVKYAVFQSNKKAEAERKQALAEAEAQQVRPCCSSATAAAHLVPGAGPGYASPSCKSELDISC